MCPFLEKFERISNKIVKVLARLAPLGSQLSRGVPQPLPRLRRAGHPPRFHYFFRVIFSLASLEKERIL
jgi:hypothetical protein